MMPKQRKHEFEDQTIVGLSLNGGDLNIRIKCWDEPSDQTTFASVVFTAISDLHIDSAPASHIESLSEDGEIIHFELEDRHALLIVIWHTSMRKEQTTKSYTFTFRSLQTKNDKK